MNLGLLAPAGLALGALSIPLVALYFLRIRRRRVQVSSLLPWHALQRSERLASPFQRFRRHLLLFLQLLVLLLLTLALARPAIRTTSADSRSVVLVVDTSASMGATDETPNRLRVAAARARSIVDGLGPTDEVMLVEAGPRTEVRVPFTRDHGKALRGLDALSPTEAEGTLYPGMQLALSLARSRPGVEVVVLSDGAGADLSALSAGDAEVTYSRVGLRTDNSGITALDLRRSPVNDLDRQLFLTVRNFGPRPAEATVEVFVDDRLLALRTETLPPDEPVSLVFDVPGAARGGLRVALDTPGDLLPADDVAWAVLTPPASRRVLLAGTDPLTARVLQADPRVELVRANPSEVDAALLDTVDCALFAGAVPDDADGLPHAVLGPWPGTPLTLGDLRDAPQVLDWNRTHPVLRFVALEGATLGRAHDVRDPGGLFPIAEADTGPLILAGERSGNRVVALTFDPYTSDLPLRVAWPVFVLNTVGWLTEGAGGGEARLLRAGRPWLRTLADGSVTEATVDGPEGQTRLTISDGVIRFAETHHVGLYQVRAGSLDALFAANLLSERESAIGPRDTLSLGAAASPVQQASIATARRELWRPLLLLALLFMALEWWAWNRRRAA